MQASLKFFISSIVLTYCLSVTAEDFVKGREDVLQDAIRIYGPVVNSGELQTLREALSKGFARLSKIQLKDLKQQGYEATNELHFLSSSSVDVTIRMVFSPESKKAVNLVFITTAFLRKNFKDILNSEKDIENKIYEILGALAHELTHPKHEFDSNGIVNRYAYSGQQASELVIDSEAVKLLRQARLPTDSLYRSLKFFFGDYPDTFVIENVFRTHPNKYVRLTAHSLAVTRDRLDRGELNFLIPILAQGDAKKIANEIRGYRDDAFTLPKDVKELLARLNARLAQARKYWAYAKLGLTPLEANVYLLWLNQGLRNGTILESDALEVVEVITKKTLPLFLCRSKACLKSLIQDLRGFESLELIPQVEAVERMPFYQVTLASELSKSLVVEGGGEIEINSNTFVLMNRKFREIQKKYIAESFWSAPRQEVNQSYSPMLLVKTFLAATFLFQGNDRPEDLVEWGEFVHQEILSRLPKDMPPGFDLSFGAMIPTSLSKQLWSTALKNPKYHSRVKALIESAWSLRGSLALSELQWNSIYDWEFIFNTLGISKDDGIIQIRKSLEDLLSKDFNKNAVVYRHDGTWGDGSRSRSPTDPPVWLDPTVEGMLRKHVVVDLNQSATYWMGHYYDMAPREEVSKEFRTLVRDYFSRAYNPETTPLQFVDDMATINQKVLGLRRIDETFLPDRYRIIIEEAKLRGLSDSAIAKIFKWEFSDAPAHRRDLIDRNSVGDIRAIFSALKKGGFAGRVIDYRKFNIALGWQKPFFLSLQKEILSDLESELKSSADAIKLVKQYRHELILETRKIEKGKHLGFQTNEFDAAYEITKIFLSHVRAQDWSVAQNLEFLYNLTRIGVNELTDAYFQKFLLPHLTSDRNAKTFRSLVKFNMLYSAELQTKITRLSMEYRTKPISDLSSIVAEVNELLPNSSFSKDKFLEEIAWKEEVSGQNLKRLIEDSKSGNWRRVNPRWAILASTAAAFIGKLNTREKLDFIDYVVDGGQKVAFPENVFRKIKSEFMKRVFAHDQVNGSTYDQLASRETMRLKTLIEAFVAQSSPVERVPLINVLVTAGEKPLLDDSEVMTELRKKFLNINKNSIEEVFFRAYLDVIRDHEKSITLSYVLANSGGGQNGTLGINSILEMFGTVGIKFGQMAAHWNLFSPEHNDQLRELFDRAAPMTKIEIENELSKTKAGRVFKSQIRKYIGILGSASIKTVVLVELKSGQRVALMIRRPHVKSIIGTNLTLAKAFLDRLKYYSTNISHPLFNPLIEALEQQIYVEINFKNEIENYKRVSTLIAEINSHGRWRKAGWNVLVPQVYENLPASQSIYAVEEVSGVSAKEFFADKSISQDEKNSVGEILAKVSLDMLFRYGKFDPDRHPGNWIIDQGKKKIYFIDPGQLIDFKSSPVPTKWDARLTLAFFLKALGDRNSKLIVHYGSLMTKVGFVEESVQTKAALSTQKIFRKSGLEEIALLKEVVSALYREGIEFNHTYTFGAMKGLMVLAGSGYVSAGRFRELLSLAIVDAMSEKEELSLREIQKNELTRVRQPRPRTSRAIFEVKSCREIFANVP